LSNMNTTFDILVIVLGSLLGIFLLLSIISVALVLKLLKSLRQVVAKGEHLVDSAEELGETFKRNAGAVGMLRILMKFMTTVNNMKK
jgi:biopolymer transport protein ExbB/TolQ